MACAVSSLGVVVHLGHPLDMAHKGWSAMWGAPLVLACCSAVFTRLVECRAHRVRERERDVRRLGEAPTH